MQPDFALSLLSRLKEEGLHTAIETHGGFSPEICKALIKVTDQFLVDLKHMDSQKHKQYTGIGNERVLDNLKQLAAHGLIIRIPVIPGFNDDNENMERSASFAKELCVPVHLLKFHKMACAKYLSLGKIYQYSNIETLSDERIFQIQHIFLDSGVTAQIGG